MGHLSFNERLDSLTTAVVEDYTVKEGAISIVDTEFNADALIVILTLGERLTEERRWPRQAVIFRLHGCVQLWTNLSPLLATESATEAHFWRSVGDWSHFGQLHKSLYDKHKQFLDNSLRTAATDQISDALPSISSYRIHGKRHSPMLRDSGLCLKKSCWLADRARRCHRIEWQSDRRFFCFYIELSYSFYWPASVGTERTASLTNLWRHLLDQICLP